MIALILLCLIGAVFLIFQILPRDTPDDRIEHDEFNDREDP